MNEKKTIKWRGLTLRPYGLWYRAPLGRAGDVRVKQDFATATSSATVGLDDPWLMGRAKAKTAEAALDLALSRALVAAEKSKKKLSDNVKLLKRLERTKLKEGA